MVKFAIDQPVHRIEDARFLTGRYTNDVNLTRQAYASFLRSPYAHATFRKIGTKAAQEASGVLGIFTCDDLKVAGIGNLSCMALAQNHDDLAIPIPPRPALAPALAHFAGEAVALVVAETLAQARDAAELIEIDYEPLPAVTEGADAPNKGTPQIWDIAKGNTADDCSLSDEAKTRDGFAKAHKVLSNSGHSILEAVSDRRRDHGWRSAAPWRSKLPQSVLLASGVWPP